MRVSAIRFSTMDSTTAVQCNVSGAVGLERALVCVAMHNPCEIRFPLILAQWICLGKATVSQWVKWRTNVENSLGVTLVLTSSSASLKRKGKKSRRKTHNQLSHNYRMIRTTSLQAVRRAFGISCSTLLSHCWESNWISHMTELEAVI